MRLTILLYLVIVTSAFAQQRSSFSYLKKTKHELRLGVGITQFLGDLGGLNKTGTDYSPVDLELNLTKPAFSVAYCYQWHPRFLTSVNFNYAQVAGNDALTKDIYRNNRNLNFKSNIFELDARAEVVLFGSTQTKRYNIKKTGQRKKKQHQLLGFVGIGAFYFNPKGRPPVTGNWEELHSLHTEGQGLPNGPKQYKRVALCLPMGLYYRLVINNKWSIGAELCYYKTFTDYIDDVSTSYYSPQALKQNYGDLSAQMADPSLGNIAGATAPNADGTGAQRGDKQKDNYMTLQIKTGCFINSVFKKKKHRSKKISLKSKF